MNLALDYMGEPSRDVFCIDVRSFCASVECVERGLDLLRTMLVIVSNSENSGSLVLAVPPMAKKVLGIPNVTRKNEVPDHPDLIIVPPRIKLCMKKNQEINNLYERFASDEDHSVFSVDESFLDATASLTYFKYDTAYELAKIIQHVTYSYMGLYVTIGIGGNPLLAKLALDNEAKNVPDFVVEWRYEDMPEKVWPISPLTEPCGIGNCMAAHLKKLSIRSIYDLTHIESYMLKECFDIMGLQPYAYSWGTDRSFLGQKAGRSTERSSGNSQALPGNYVNKE